MGLTIEQQRDIGERINDRITVAEGTTATLGDIWPEVAGSFLLSDMITQYVATLAQVADDEGVTFPTMDAVERLTNALMCALSTMAATAYAVGVETVGTELTDGGSDPWNVVSFPTGEVWDGPEQYGLDGRGDN